MGTPSKKHMVNVLIKNHGKLFSKEIGISLQDSMPSSLFQWLTASILFSARIGSTIAVEAAKSLNKRGWKTAQQMATSTWSQRVKALHEAGYSRYQEKTATMLGDTANLLIDQYKGDIRKLRQAAQKRPEDERKLLKQCKGLGDTGVDIFFREVQMSWKELTPFADNRALGTAKKLKLGHQAKDLAKLTTERDFPKLIAALVRVKNNKLEKEIVAKASKAKEVHRYANAIAICRFRPLFSSSCRWLVRKEIPEKVDRARTNFRRGGRNNLCLCFRTGGQLSYPEK